MAIKATAEIVANAIKKVTRNMAATMEDMLARPYLGKSYSGDRDIYKSLGYKKNLEFADYLALYRRQGVARTVINAPVAACWRTFPEIEESTDDDTEFEKKLGDLIKKLNLHNKFVRLDKLASVGRFAVLLLGFKDGLKLDQPCVRASDLLYVQPYSESSVVVKEYETDQQSERFGLPKFYTVTMRTVSTGQPAVSSGSQTVHWTRVLHVAEECLDNDIEGTPRLEAIYNDLKNLELVSCGSAEMFWRGALPGLVFNLLDGAALSPEEETKFSEEIKEYIHEFKRILRLRNIEVKSLAPTVVDPKGHIDAAMGLIAAGARMPQRILSGSERGQLASVQDDENWQVRVGERQLQHCETNIVRPFVDRCILVQALPKPKEDYTIKWADLLAPSKADRADIGLKRTQALVAYSNSIGAQDIVPPEVALPDLMNFPEDRMLVIEEQLALAAKDANGNPDDLLDQPPAPPAPDGQVPGGDNATA